MRNLIALPVLGLAVILQSAIISRISLLAGYADVILVVLAGWALQEQVQSAWHWAVIASIFTVFVSRLPWLVVVAGYFAIVFLARMFSRRIWQAPLVAMFGVTFLGTLFLHLISFLSLNLSGIRLPFTDVLGWVTLPSLLLNMILAVPVLMVMRDLSRWVYPPLENE